METKNTATPISLADYKKKNRIQTVTPDGLEVEVRTASLSDFFEIGKIPQAFVSAAKDGAKMVDLSESDMEFVKKITELVLTKMVKLIGKSAGCKIVSKSSFDAESNELSIEDISKEESKFLVETSLNNSGLSKEAADQAKPFPSEPQPSPAA